MKLGTITIDHRFRGPARSGNGGYVSGRVAQFIPGVARVRLHVPPPLDVPFEVHARRDGVVVVDPSTSGEEGEARLVAQGWPAKLELEVPPSPGIEAATEASRRYVGFQSHRFSTCFVCGTERKAPDALQVYAGPVEAAGAEGAVPAIVACSWTPPADLSSDGVHLDPLYVWCVLDCPGGFSFQHPQEGTILMGELTVRILERPLAGRPHVIAGWEIERQGRKHLTGTAIYDGKARCLAFGVATWFEVPNL